MATYAYTARDRDGNARQGVIDAQTLNDARELVRTRELFVVTIAPKTGQSGGAGLFSRRKRKVKIGDLVIMSRQFATLFRAGISIVECLNAVSRQTESPMLAGALRDVRLSVLEGNTIADAMHKHPKIFNDKYVALIRAGETGGLLEQTLDTAADQFDREAELQEKIKSAMVYPAIVMIAAVGVVIFMLVFIVPVFATVYTQFKAKLPAPTLMLISLSHIITTYWWAVLLITGVTTFFSKRFIATDRGKHIYHRLLLKMPLLGKLNRKVAIARFAETLAGSVKSGIPILQALAVSGQTCANVIISDVVDQVALKVKDGSPMAAPLEQSGEFPALVTYMVAAGEQSGNLDQMLEEISRFYARDIEFAVNKLTRSMEPLMTIVIGIIVLVILLALYMPVFSLTQVLKS